MKIKNIGIEVTAPKKECQDKHCPFHGSVKIRGKIFTGTIIKASMQKTVLVEWPRAFFLPKYERYEKRRTRIKAHLPDCIEAKKGDKVKVVETRPISKTKNFVVVEVIEHASN
ncbi:MAG: 30S ribosomal protein S17 [Candidatus Nanoarchaeia archaeon]